MHRMSSTLGNLSSQVTDGVAFVYKEGGGLNWLKSDGYTALKRAVGTGGSKKRRSSLIWESTTWAISTIISLI